MQESKGERTSEIAAAVQAGKADILSLWAAVERFAWQQALKWARAMEGRAGVEESDLLQVAFIALMGTLPIWDVNKGEFLTLYGIKLKAEFTEACGQRTQRARCDPINSVCRSVDEPIGEEDSGLTLGDAIADEAAEEAFEDMLVFSVITAALTALRKQIKAAIVTPGVGTVVGVGLGLILGLSIYSVRKDPKKGTQRLVSIGRSVLLGLLAGVLGVGLAALGIVSAGTAFIISAAIGLALKFFVDSVDDSKVRKATSGFTGTRVSTKAPTRSRRVAAQNLDGNAPVYNEIPALASGAVIPPNRKFLAVLGDQKSGTNVEAPLSTIKQAVMEAMAQGSREPINVNLVVDGKTLARVVVPNINNMTRAAGKPVLLY